MTAPTSATARLAARLRELRLSHWDDPVTQPVLGSLLGVKPPTISSWEKPDGSAIPTVDRLRRYALLFATRRSLEADQLLQDDELTSAERATRDALLDDLLELRTAALEEAGEPTVELRNPWFFPDGAAVRIICGRLAQRPDLASGSHRNYMALTAYADQDALIELFGHLRAMNPTSDVGFELARRLEDDDLHAHLVVLGNLARTQHNLLNWLPQDLPVTQVADPEWPDGEVFEVTRSDGVVERYGPKFVRRGRVTQLVEDVGFFARTSSPLDAARTLTFCSGVYTRGVYGAVRCFTDRNLMAANARYLQHRFGDAPTFGFLARVRVIDHAIGTPKLEDEQVRVHEFSRSV